MMRLVPADGSEAVRVHLPTPVGMLVAVVTGTALVRADFLCDLAPPSAGVLLSMTARPPAWFEDLTARALAGDLDDGQDWLLIDPGFTPLEAAMVKACSKVPFGTVMSYGALAKCADAPGRARAAGRAVQRSPAALFVPTHRVMRRDGTPSRQCQRAVSAAALRCYEDAYVAAPRAAWDAFGITAGGCLDPPRAVNPSILVHRRAPRPFLP